MTAEERRKRIESLKAELERLEQDDVPQLRQEHDMSWVETIDACCRVVMVKANEGVELGDYEHDVFQAAMEAVYGRDIWTWWNKRR